MGLGVSVSNMWMIIRSGQKRSNSSSRLLLLSVGKKGRFSDAAEAV